MTKTADRRILVYSCTLFNSEWTVATSMGWEQKALNKIPPFLHLPGWTAEDVKLFLFYGV